MSDMPAPPPTNVSGPDAAPPIDPARSLRNRRIAIGAGIGLLLVGLWLVTFVPGWLAQNPDAPADGSGTVAPASRQIRATLFYVSDDGAELVAVTRDLPFGASPAQQARIVADAQVTPAPGRVSAIPAGTNVRAVFLGPRGEAFVDLSPEVMHGHKGGSLGEALAVFAIVNAITTNIPDIKSVQILIDGREVDSLAGHIDLREPIGRSDAWIRKGP